MYDQNIKSGLTGTWKGPPGDFSETIVIRHNQTFTVTQLHYGEKDSFSGNWSATKIMLTFVWVHDGLNYTQNEPYELSNNDNTLTICFNHETVLYTRQQ